ASAGAGKASAAPNPKRQRFTWFFAFIILLPCLFGSVVARLAPCAARVRCARFPAHAGTVVELADAALADGESALSILANARDYTFAIACAGGGSLVDKGVVKSATSCVRVDRVTPVFRAGSARVAVGDQGLEKDSLSQALHAFDHHFLAHGQVKIPAVFTRLPSACRAGGRLFPDNIITGQHHLSICILRQGLLLKLCPSQGGRVPGRGGVCQRLGVPDSVDGLACARYAVLIAVLVVLAGPEQNEIAVLCRMTNDRRRSGNGLAGAI